MRISKMFPLFGLVLTVGCAAVETTAAPTAAILSTEFPSPTGAALPIEIPSQTATILPAAIPSPSPEIVMMIDDFEGTETFWTVCTDPECADSSAVDVTLTADHASHGKQALKLNFKKNDRPKAVFYLQKTMDLSAGGAVRFDIFNPGTVDGVGFALTTGPDSIWYESDSVPVAEGKTTPLSFDLTAGNYKTLATNWEFRASLAHLDNVTRLSIIIYPKATGAVYLDNLRLVAAP
jgi:hypothetical protein